MQKTNRNFGLIMSFGFLVLGIVIPFIKRQNVHYFLVIVSALFFILAIISPMTLNFFRVRWLKLGEVLGKINSKIIFSIIYILIFSTIHLIFKILRRDKLKLKWKKYSSTYADKTQVSSFLDPF